MSHFCVTRRIFRFRTINDAEERVQEGSVGRREFLEYKFSTCFEIEMPNVKLSIAFGLIKFLRLLRQLKCCFPEKSGLDAPFLFMSFQILVTYTRML